MKIDTSDLHDHNSGQVPRRVIDVFPFYNELDLLELRLRTLYDHVDFFELSECEETFSGKPKPMCYAKNKKNAVLPLKTKLFITQLINPS